MKLIIVLLIVIRIKTIKIFINNNKNNNKYNNKNINNNKCFRFSYVQFTQAVKKMLTRQLKVQRRKISLIIITIKAKSTDSGVKLTRFKPFLPS